MLVRCFSLFVWFIKMVIKRWRKSHTYESTNSYASLEQLIRMNRSTHTHELDNTSDEYGNSTGSLYSVFRIRFPIYSVQQILVYRLMNQFLLDENATVFVTMLFLFEQTINNPRKLNVNFRGLYQSFNSKMDIFIVQGL